MESVGNINQTNKAKKKLVSIAKNNGLDPTLVSYLFSFHWNYDGREGGTWVYDRDLLPDADYHSRYKYLFTTLGLPQKPLSQEEVIATLHQTLACTDETSLRQHLLVGVVSGSYCRVSEFASYWYLRNATTDKLATLDWTADTCGPRQIADNLFFKLFRGGSIERYNLDYLYTDLIVELPYQLPSVPKADWLSSFIESVADSPQKPTLSDLRTMLKPYCKGDRYFRQTVLEALSYAGYLKVEDHPVETLFIPDYRNKLSAHVNTNEWTYPLRFW